MAFSLDTCYRRLHTWSLFYKMGNYEIFPPVTTKMEPRTDTASGDTAVLNGALEGVAALGSGYAMYTSSNIALTDTHSYSGPGAFKPASKDTGSYQAIVTGVVLSIQRAHESLALGTLSFAETNINDVNINRSGFAYLANPAAKRAQYEYDTDKAITMLRFKRNSDGLNLGVLAWHSIYGRNMLNNNTHVSDDNKGVAYYLFERSQAAVNSNFVAAISQFSVGGTSTNVLGAYCDDGSGHMCKLSDSICGETSYTAGTSQTCFPLANGTVVQTCSAALDYSFAGGTTDGPGFADFTQNDPNTNAQNPFWALVSGVLSVPTAQQVACQSPEPILLSVGTVNNPSAWSPDIIDVQRLRVGQFIIIVSLSEATTTIAAAAIANKITTTTPKVVLVGPANTYAHYVATHGYELHAYIHLSVSNIGFLVASNTSVATTGPLPPYNRDNSISINTGVAWDNPPSGHSMGDVLTQPAASYKIGANHATIYVSKAPSLS
ncbi:Neutral/alkaline nonlysosomal ceramidase [Calycina marina]|uniref:Neutral ceramidase n=1 Tax=Calycina marina TaxID=1763456 RepID=A0A9P7Z464_9HELO|nr:Neutral/alkaline nonlysosomal ceramidase [Calycina marina]